MHQHQQTVQFEISPRASRAETCKRKMLGRAVKLRGWRWIKENHQWWLLGKQKLWGAVTNSDLTVYSTRHLGVELQLRRLIAETMALKHLVVYLWIGLHAVAVENISRKEAITISFLIWCSLTAQYCAGYYSFEQVCSWAGLEIQDYRWLQLEE